MYKLYYWPTIQGRGEFIRLALEEAQVAYVDVARRKGGVAAMMKKMAAGPAPAFAPPFLDIGGTTLAQTANILQFLGAAHGLAPRDAAGRLWVNQLQLTVADMVAEVHDTHHPVSVSQTYEAQTREARKRAAGFVDERMPKFLGYFEQVLRKAPTGRRRGAGGGYLLGDRLCYADLSLFQLVAGLGYAFPKALARLAPDLPRLMQLADQVAARPAIAAYLASPRRIPFSEEGIFRHYRALDR